MARSPCELCILLLAAAATFIYIQVRLFATQSHYADRLAQVEKSENQCTSQLRSLIDQVSSQQEKIVALEEMKIHQDEEHVHLKILIQDLKKRSVLTLVNNNVVPVAAVVVMAYNRPDYLQRTVESILKYQTSVALKFPLFISQDGINGEVKKKALSYNEITYMQHLDLEPVRTERPGELIAYYKIAKHYKWALDELFIKHNFARVIILEDDMEIAPDFFDYFEAAAKLLDNDKTIMAVSSWNDNGQKQFVYDPKGHRDRQFIHPEVCRTYNFGEHGSIMGQFFRQYLEPIKLNDVHIKWNSEDLTYLKEDGMPRTAYKVVVFRYKSSRRRIYLVGPDSLSQLRIQAAAPHLTTEQS
uniref:Alpha-1,3-mannosyl-glycoprotein 2-beta-N-acetylglucosaminyltransferase n=1 Tax=Oryza punctata TaxID=4537 RepID=A0A0E0K7D8_ORYPU